MRDPNKLNPIYSNQPNSINLKNPPVYDIEDWDLNDQKEYRKYVREVKKIVRGSFEYKQMIDFLKENVGMTACSFFENVNNVDYSHVRIEIHHEPLTLDDIVDIVTRKRIFYAEDLNEEMTAMEVMMLHYKLLVGLIPLSETVHELVHNRYLFIPSDKVYGNYREFLKIYDQFILPEQKEYIEAIEEATGEFNDKVMEDLLSTKYVYVNADYGYQLPSYEQVQHLLEQKKEERLLQSQPLRTIYYKTKPDPNLEVIYLNGTTSN